MLLLRELFGSLNVAMERVHLIVTVELGIVWVYARWVRHDLSDEQKACVNSADMLSLLLF
jgi:hypothetical protein